MQETLNISKTSKLTPTKEELLGVYNLICESREVSLLGRKDVFMGRAKFGIFGDGKELAQAALARVFKKGDFRSGYYRDQTLLAATGQLTWQQLFAQLYAHADVKHDVFSAGRSMNAHYGNRWLDSNGDWLDQTEMQNSVMDVSSTAGQMVRSIGIGYASKLYREASFPSEFNKFSKGGNEICFTTIGDASTSQGMFFESINAAGVLQIPCIFSIWDDGFGISVPTAYQTTKGSISEVLEGFQRNQSQKGLEIIKVKGYDYMALVAAYEKAERLAREEHIPCVVHVYDLTQPQGHSTSGSHERYKTEERLTFEKEFDCNIKYKKWLLSSTDIDEKELGIIEETAKQTAKKARKAAWDAVREDINSFNKKGLSLFNALLEVSEKKADLLLLKKQFASKVNPLIKDGVSLLKAASRVTRFEKNEEIIAVRNWIQKVSAKNNFRYSSHLYSEGSLAPLRFNNKDQSVKPEYSGRPKEVEGRTVINSYFDQLLTNRPEVFAIGEDVGLIGDVNQGFAGLQSKHGKLRVTDTGIREATIIGQGIGAAMRGLRPIVEVQYIDYIYYCLHILTDDLACLRYRSFGQQKAPLVIRTRGHRLEGIWHSGSPMAVMINSLRGIHILAPRNFVQAAGMYNNILEGDDPALIIEPLNSYRRKEQLPTNLDKIKVALGEVEILKSGNDFTVVTYGSMCSIVMDAARELKKLRIDVEVIDVQSLLPFDLGKGILKSIQKTNRVLFVDEDMPGGCTAYMMQQVIEDHGAYKYLDSPAKCLSAKEHRPPYGSDGDYFTKPNKDDVIEFVYNMMREVEPQKFPSIS